MMDVKTILRNRFKPIPARLSDPDLQGKLFLRRLRVPELQAYLKGLGDGTDADSPDKQALLLSMIVCDADGQPVFRDAAEASDLLGDCWLPLCDQATDLIFPGAGDDKNPTAPKPTRSRG